MENIIRNNETPNTFRLSFFDKNLLIKKDITIMDDKGTKKTEALHGKARASDSFSVKICIILNNIDKNPKVIKGKKIFLFL